MLYSTGLLPSSHSVVDASAKVLDVLTPLSDCRHETVEKIMERRTSGVSYMCWMDFHNAILCCGFLCARLMSLYFVSSILCLSSLSFPATTPRATTPHPYHHGLSCLCIHPGYHAIVYFYSLVITPELSRSTTLTRTSGYCTRHSSSYFVVYLSPAITPPVLLHLHHHRAPHVPTYTTRRPVAIVCLLLQ